MTNLDLFYLQLNVIIDKFVVFKLWICSSLAARKCSLSHFVGVSFCEVCLIFVQHDDMSSRRVCNFYTKSQNQNLCNNPYNLQSLQILKRKKENQTIEL